MTIILWTAALGKGVITTREDQGRSKRLARWKDPCTHAHTHMSG